MSKSLQGKAARRKGHAYERKIVNEMKELGYENAQTSRYASRSKDDKKVDIDGVPFLIQCKSVVAAIRYTPLIAEIKENFKGDPEEELPVMVFHKRGRKEEDELIVMTKKDLYKVLKQIEK